MKKYRFPLAMIGCIAMLSLAKAQSTIPPAVLEQQIEKARLEINKRFIDPEFGILYDYAGKNGQNSLPTPEECRNDKPNGLNWWAPMENGAFFNGIYLDGLCNRWKMTKKKS